ncbi:MBL fold metallo-hydrolase [uncultured Roseobacter sp.]|uniref:MBL fold metallo-hydrolase n=1 Tax=uncultured Roseobacter sp. TaxID=114847 RepID=UPI00262F3681|nr:MBL fold metallo-hydrolase [uncultured Roseobacter sp.]
MNRRNFLQIAGAGAAAALMPKSAFAAIGSSQVFTSDANSALVDSTVLMGEESAVLIDAQFTVPAATQLAGITEATGRRLETIFITHGHPDHYLGLEVFANRFAPFRSECSDWLRAMQLSLHGILGYWKISRGL